MHRLVARLTSLTLVASVLIAAGAGSAFALAPDAPAQPTVTAGNAQITVTFSAPTSDGGSPITGYTAACSSSDGGSPGSNTDIASPITVTGLTNGNTYTCTVTATNADGDSPASPPSDAAIPRTVPDAPGQPSIADGDEQITLTFGTPASDGGSPITGYIGTCTSTDGGAAGTNTDVASPITVTGLTNGKTYICTATATNAAGDGPASPPSAPSIPEHGPRRARHNQRWRSARRRSPSPSARRRPTAASRSSASRPRAVPVTVARRAPIRASRRRSPLPGSQSARRIPAPSRRPTSTATDPCRRRPTLRP